MKSMEKNSKSLHVVIVLASGQLMKNLGWLEGFDRKRLISTIIAP